MQKLKYIFSKINFSKFLFVIKKIVTHFIFEDLIIYIINFHEESVDYIN